MDTVLGRANQLFAFATTVLAALTALCWATGQFILPQAHPNFTFEPKNLAISTGYEARGILTESNRLDIRYAMHIDVSDAFNWSVKQLFLMLVAEYSTKKNTRNQIIIWDRIVMRDELDKHVITIKNGKSKYEFWDDGKGLRGHENMTFSLHWNTITNAGSMPISSTAPVSIRLPADAPKKK